MIIFCVCVLNERTDYRDRLKSVSQSFYVPNKKFRKHEILENIDVSYIKSKQKKDWHILLHNHKLNRKA